VARRAAWRPDARTCDHDAGPGPAEKVVVAPIDLAALRADRTRRLGHDVRRRLRSEVHTRLRERHLPPADADDHPLTRERIGWHIGGAWGQE
jgi:hypothetical protein